MEIAAIGSSFVDLLRNIKGYGYISCLLFVVVFFFVKGQRKPQESQILNISTLILKV